MKFIKFCYWNLLDIFHIRFNYKSHFFTCRTDVLASFHYWAFQTITGTFSIYFSFLLLKHKRKKLFILQAFTQLLVFMSRLTLNICSFMTLWLHHYKTKYTCQLLTIVMWTLKKHITNQVYNTNSVFTEYGNWLLRAGHGMIWSNIFRGDDDNL